MCFSVFRQYSCITLQDHLHHVSQVLDTLTKRECFVTKKTKISFRRQDIGYLGHVISQLGVYGSLSYITVSSSQD